MWLAGIPRRLAGVRSGQQHHRRLHGNPPVPAAGLLHPAAGDAGHQAAATGDGSVAVSPEGPTPPEEQGAAWLAASDQALAAGRPPLSGDAPPDLRTRLERGARQRKTSRAIVRWPDSGFRSPVPNLAVDWPHVLRTPAAAPARLRRPSRYPHLCRAVP